jgi:MFS family permease
MISGAATAALVELDPRRGEQRPAMLAGLAQAGGSALGPLVAGVLAEWAARPLELCFVVLLGATAVAAAFVLVLPEPARGNREPWRIQRPRVPDEIRPDFARVSLTAATGWGSVALYLSIVPSYAAELLKTSNLALLGAVSGIALLASCVALVVSKRRGSAAPRRGQATGLVLLAVGLACLVAAAPSGSLAVLVVGAVLAGAGHGLAFLDAQDELNRIAPAERRGEVTAAFICCIYAVVGGGVIATGLLDLRFSLSLSVSVVALVLAATALAAAAWQVRGLRRR